MSRNRVWVLVALVCALARVPTTAYASDGFLGGLEDLTGTREVEQESYEDRFQEEYEPELREVESSPVRALPEDATTVDYVNDTLDSFNAVEMAGRDYTLLATLSRFFGAQGALGNAMTSMLLLPAVGMVFFWWGLRKSKNMIMNALRKGKASV